MITTKRGDLEAPPHQPLDMREPRSKAITRVVTILGSGRAITADTALRLGPFFDTTPKFWLGLQERYELEFAGAKLGHRLAKEVWPLTVV